MRKEILAYPRRVQCWTCAALYTYAAALELVEVEREPRHVASDPGNSRRRCARCDEATVWVRTDLPISAHFERADDVDDPDGRRLVLLRATDRANRRLVLGLALALLPLAATLAALLVWVMGWWI